MTETGKGELSPQKPPSRLSAVWETIRNFGKKPTRVNPPPPSEPPIEPKIIATPSKVVKENRATTVVAAAPITLEPEQAKEVEPTQPMVENQERILRPANRIFFHGTRLRNLPDIRSHGLYADKDVDVIGRDLFESLYMEQEYSPEIGVYRTPFIREEMDLMDSLPRNERERIREEATKFVLTVWGDSKYFKKTSDQWWNNRTGQYGLTGELEGLVSTPQTARARLGDTLNPEEHAHLPSDDLLAGIPITRESKDALIAAQLNFMTNRKTADQIEVDLTNFLTQPGNVTIIRDGYNISDLSHDLISRIQQQVILFKDGFLVKSAEEDRVRGNFRQLAWDISLKLKTANEPICIEYLNRLLQRLSKVIKQHRLTNSVYDEQGRIRPPLGRQNFVAEEYLYTDAWGTTPHDDISRVARQMGLTH